LYRYELRLVPRSAALVLLGLRVAVLALIVFLVGFQPVYARDVKFDLPGRILVAVDRSDSTDVADPQRTPLERLRLARALRLAADVADDATVDGWIKEYEDGRTPRWDERDAKQRSAHDAVCRRADELTRSEAARRVLAADGVGLLPALAKQHDVQLVGFH